jgi:RNA polymerase primary sigma factor
LGPVARAHRILGPSLKYVEHPSFDDPNARDAILDPLTHPCDDQVSCGFQHPGSLVRLPARRSGASFLSREQEVHLFRKMNYLKCRANQLKEQLDPDWPNSRDLDEIEQLQCEALALRNRIVEMNLRLVVSVAKTRVRAGYDLSECVGDGSVALIRAVDSFDFARGNRFSTYAVHVIRNRLAENGRRLVRHRVHAFPLHEESLAARDRGVDEVELEDLQNQRGSALRCWLDRLDKRERRIIARRYGIGGCHKHTLERIGQDLGLSKERVRQIAGRTQAKLREFARREAIEI